MISYFAKALNARGKVEQVLVTKAPGAPRTTQAWTGKVYRTDREADRDIAALNTAVAKESRAV